VELVVLCFYFHGRLHPQKDGKCNANVCVCAYVCVRVCVCVCVRVYLCPMHSGDMTHS